MSKGSRSAVLEDENRYKKETVIQEFVKKKQSTINKADRRKLVSALSHIKWSGYKGEDAASGKVAKVDKSVRKHLDFIKSKISITQRVFATLMNSTKNH